MSITNYTELQSALGVWLDRTDLDDVMSDIIRLAEHYINFGGSDGEPLRVRQMQAQTTLQVSQGVATLPDDFLSAIAIISQANTHKVLERIATSSATGVVNAGALPSHYQLIGNELKILPQNDADVSLIYYAQIPSLSDIAPSNWLLEQHSDLYLRACQMMAAEFIKDYNQASLTGQVTDRMINQLNDAELYDGLRHSEMSLPGYVV